MAKDLKGKELPKGIIQRPDGRYMGRFTFSGERYTLYNLDLKELKKELNNLRYEVENGLYVKETNMTVDAWFRIWIEDYKKNTVKYGTYIIYNDMYDAHICKVLGKKKLADIRPQHIQNIYNTMSKDGYSQKTIGLVAVVLGGMFKQAYRNQIIRKNPVELVTRPRKQTKKKDLRVMNREEQKIFLKYATDSLYYNVYQVALATGLRSGELRVLEWEDIDFKNRSIHVTGTLKYHKGEGYRKDLPKTATSDRIIPMIDEVYKILKQQRKEQAEMKMKLGTLWCPAAGLENLVFTSQYNRKGYGIPIGSAALNDDLKKIIERIRDDGIKFEAITPHTLRHTFATRGLENGIQPKVMQELLGHTSFSMTMDIYSHVLPDTKADEIQKIANIL